MLQEKRMAWSRLLHLAATVVGAVMCGCAAAQDYPVRPVTVVIPNEAGGGIDAVARLLQPHLQSMLGQTLVFVNKGGAAGAIGAESVARADPTGYTLLLAGNAPLDVLPALRKTPYDPLKDFSPVGLIAAYPSFLAVAPQLGVNSLAELIALAKARPGALNYGSVGLGSTSNINTEQLLAAAGIKVAHVPYKGGGQVQQALLANEIQFTITTGANILPLTNAGRLKLLAISSGELAAVAPPGTPAISDTIKGLSWKGWYGLFAPAATPLPAIQKLRDALQLALSQPDVKEQLLRMGALPSGPAENIPALVADGLVRTRAVMDKTGMKLE
jgi:tripartite-type tricarboxylate transporter receptor subunit TctC